MEGECQTKPTASGKQQFNRIASESARQQKCKPQCPSLDAMASCLGLDAMVGECQTKPTASGKQNFISRPERTGELHDPCHQGGLLHADEKCKPSQRYYSESAQSDQKCKPSIDTMEPR